MVDVIDSFNGNYRFLSNFYSAEIELDGLIYPTLEHAYQAAKTENLTDRRKIRQAATPGKAKALGKQVTCISDWEHKKIEVMEKLVRQKFTKHQALKEKLLATGDATLQEGNTWKDAFWGTYRGHGQNHLGKILMKVRSELQKKSNLSQFEKSFNQKLDSFGPKLSSNLPNLLNYGEEISRKVLKFLLESACAAQNSQALSLGCRCILQLPREWTLQHIDQAVRVCLNPDNDDYEFRHLAELYSDLDTNLLKNLIERGCSSTNDEIRDAANDFKNE